MYGELGAREIRCYAPGREPPVYMRIERYLKAAPWLSLAGVLFAGYLSSIKLFSGACAFSEPCPTLWGYPSCVYGFFIFLALFAVSTVAYYKKVRTVWPIRTNLILSLSGILFAGYFAVPEIVAVLSHGTRYTLGLPTCVYGLVFFGLVFGVTVAACVCYRRGCSVKPAVVPSSFDRGNDL